MTLSQPPPKTIAGSVGERACRRGELAGRDDAHDRHRREDVEQRRGDRAEDRGARDRALGVLDLVGRDGRRLEADERPQRERRGGGQQAEAGAVRRERLVVAAVDEEQSDDADDGQRDELEHRGDELHHAALARTEDVREGQQPDQRDGRQRAEQVVVADRGPEDGEVADERDGDRRVAGPDRDPVAPRGLEADEVAERPLGVGVRPTGARQRAPEVGEHERQQHRAGARDEPAEQGDRASRAGERGGQQEDARADHVADDEGRGHPQAHRSLQLWFAVGRRRREAAEGWRTSCAPLKWLGGTDRPALPAGGHRDDIRVFAGETTVSDTSAGDSTAE